MNSKIKILDQNTTDNEYLHKDFHGALCFAIKYLDDNFGAESTVEYLKQVGNTYFAPLSTKLKSVGLSALSDHFKNIFEKENGQFTIACENEILTIEVHKCPAITHLKKTNHLFTERYCETTVVVNDTICSNAGFSCSCVYEPGQGKCIQKFWKGN
jgi:hypothetical protein